MKRAQRLDHFRDGLESSEKEHRSRLAAAEAKVGEARERLTELQRYRDEYLQGLGNRTAGGIDAAALRDYHAFVARIGEAVRQQTLSLSRTELECEFERQRWHEAAARSRAVAGVVERWRQEERVAAARAEQRESDEWARQISQRPNLENP
jgi:flagellar FliJ protein